MGALMSSIRVVFEIDIMWKRWSIRCSFVDLPSIDIILSTLNTYFMSHEITKLANSLICLPANISLSIWHSARYLTMFILLVSRMEEGMKHCAVEHLKLPFSRLRVCTLPEYQID
jgi:hypothetical protein